MEQISGLFLSVKMTLFFVGGFFVLAFLFGILWKRFSFCKMICPIGTLLGTFSRLSFIGVRTDKSKCATCTTKECLLGAKANPCPMFNNVPSLDTNKNCLICTNCIKNCPHDSAKLKLISPGKEIVEKKSFDIKESLFVIALLGFTFTLTTNGTAFFRAILSFFRISVSGGLLRFFDFVLAIGLVLAFFLLVNKLLSLIWKHDFKGLVKNQGYVFLPLVFSIFLFSITFGFLHSFIPLNEFQVSIAKYVLLMLGALWSLYLVFKLSNKKVVQFVYVLILVCLVVIWILLIIPGPGNLVGEDLEVYVYTGDTVSLDLFSMGYYPKNIVVQKGDLVKLNLINRDMDHALDIDEFHIHSIVSGGDNVSIEFLADKPGEYDYYCSIPGHEEAGMKGKLIVEE